MLILFLAVYSTVALMVAIQAKKTTHRLVAIGCMVLLIGQSLINMAVATGSMPTTGLPFPMFSYGGSSMIASLITTGILIRVARESRGADVLSLSRAARQAANEGASKLHRAFESAADPNQLRKASAEKDVKTARNLMERQRLQDVEATAESSHVRKASAEKDVRTAKNLLKNPRLRLKRPFFKDETRMGSDREMSDRLSTPTPIDEA